MEVCELLYALSKGRIWPAQILVVHASQEEPNLAVLEKSLRSFPNAFARNIRLLIPDDRPLYPGAARNVGLDQIHYDWIAFLDVNTIPSSDWLQLSFSAADSLRRPLILGSTQYFGCSWQQRLFVQSTYGEKPLRTLPGSLMHRNVIARVGGFLPRIRAGEDTDWLVRARQFGFDTTSGIPSTLTYRAVPASLRLLAFKWYRNYSSCAPVVFHLETQKSIYFIVVNLVLLFFAFRWNALFAGWHESNIFYVANVSKKVFVSIIIVYAFVRGFWMPASKGVKSRRLIPFRWLLLAWIAFVLDVVKLFAFLRIRPKM